MTVAKKQSEFKIVVLDERPVPLVEDEESIRALATHPGWIALMNRLKLQKAALETTLNTKRHSDIRDVDSLQNGIKWIGYLQNEINKTVSKKAEAKAVAVRPTEQQEFEKVFAQIQGV